MNSAFKDFARGTKVQDLWFKDWGTGVIVKRTKKFLHVQFFGGCAKRWSDEDGVMRWDGPHVRAFLRKAD